MTPKVLFLRNDCTATEAMLADVFTECGFEIDTFDVVPPERDDHPAGDVTFPDPTH
ncbi:type 1 glutamine amidotransferase, partial [Mycolicibacterium porcinum]